MQTDGLEKSGITQHDSRLVQDSVHTACAVRCLARRCTVYLRFQKEKEKKESYRRCTHCIPKDKQQDGNRRGWIREDNKKKRKKIHEWVE